MQHQVGYRKLGRPTEHRLALLRNMVTSLILADRIETTLPKAKELRRVAERMVTLAKDGSIAARRRAAGFVRGGDALTKLFSTLAERYQNRNGGYTRIIRAGVRRGDAASLAIIEYVDGVQATSTDKSTKKAKRGAVKTAKPAKAAKPAKSAKSGSVVAGADTAGGNRAKPRRRQSQA